MIADNLKAVTDRIARACERSGRQPDEVCLVCVTKAAPVEAIREAIAAGAVVLGENRVQDAAAKHAVVGDAAAWHLIGHLQTNKVRDAVRVAALIHSVDSLRLATAIDREAAKAGKVQDCLVQVNVSGEATKFGVAAADAVPLIRDVSLLPHISVRGLMTIAPATTDPETVRPVFRRLRELRDEINDRRLTLDELAILSMGMTDDFEVAIEEGSTMVRVGRTVFGAMRQQNGRGIL